MRPLPVLVFLGAFAFFLSRAYPGPAPLDSAELAAAASTLGVAHPPGYPLYVLAGRLWCAFAPGGAAYRMNVFSGLCAALSAGVLSALLLEAGGAAAALAAAASAVLPGSLQRLAVAAEVFGPHLLLLALFLAAIHAALERSSFRALALAAFLAGLALANQPVALCAGPALAWAAWRLHRRSPLSAAEALGLAALFLLPLGLYLALPIRARAGPVLDWEEPSTWDRFWSVVLRRRYGTLQLAQGAGGFTASGAWSSLKLFGSLAWAQVGPAWLALSAAGAWLQRKKRDFFWACLMTAVLAGPAFFIASRMSPGPNASTVMERFLPSFLLIASVWIGWAVLERPRAGSVLFLLGLAWHPPSAWADARGAFFAYDHGLALLRSLPPGSLLVAERADEAEFGLAYERLALGRRPDVRFVDANAGVTPSIYGADYYGVWGPRRLRRREEVEGPLVAGWPGPVYYATFEPGMTAVPKVRDGLLFRAKGPARDVDWLAVLAVRPAFGSARDRRLYEAYGGLLTRSLLEERRFDEAARAARRTTAEAEDPAAWLSWASVWAFTAGDFPLAAEAGAASARLRPEPATLTNLGAALERLGRPREAVERYREALLLDPSNLQALYNLGAACWSMKNAACAAGAWERYLALKPENAEVQAWAERARRRRP